MNVRKTKLAAAAALLAAALAGCSSGGGGNNDGTLSVSLMDAPVDSIDSLYITITEAWIKPQDGPAFQLELNPDVAMPVDLLSLTDDENAAVVIDAANLEPRRYNWLELTIDDAPGASYAMTSEGGMEPVEIDIDVPSNRVRLVSGFDIGPNAVVEFLFDWDVRKGLTNPVGKDGYFLRPAFRVLEVGEYGAITGNISATTLSGDADCADMDGQVVYVYEGEVTPGEFGSATEPYTTVDPTEPGDPDGLDYRVVVMPGTYTIAFTCLADMDTDADGESITFKDPVVLDSDVVTTDGSTVAGPDF